jgi:hypothetical protein
VSEILFYYVYFFSYLATVGVTEFHKNIKGCCGFKHTNLITDVLSVKLYTRVLIIILVLIVRSELNEVKNVCVFCYWTFLTFWSLAVFLRSTRFNIQKLYMVLALRSVFCRDLRTDSDFCFIHHKLIAFYNRGGKCLQCGTD